MDNEQGQGQAAGQSLKTTDQVTSWFNEAPVEDIVTGTVTGLKRVAQFGHGDRAKFYGELRADPQIMRLLEEIKTPA
jgi:hypothetical protein